MAIQRFRPKKTAPLQYLLRKLNSNAGLVVPGWGTTPLMVGLILLLFVFLLIALQLANSSIMLQGIEVNWSALKTYTAQTETSTPKSGQFTSTATGIFLGLLGFVGACIAFITYAILTYPADQE